MPIISVIVPVYKVEKYLAPCIDSLLAQTFQDIEIILVDDGSPDTCPKLCDEYAAQDSRIRVIHQQNGGLSCARNTGIDAARGQYLCFVDSDDIVTADYCQTLYDLLLPSNGDFSVCGVLRFQDGDDPAVPSSPEEVCTMSNVEFLEMQVAGNLEFGVWNKLYRKAVFDSLRFAPGRLNEDVIFSADLAKSLTNGVVCSTKKCYLYRQREGGIVSTQAVRYSPDRIFAGRHLVQSVQSCAPHLEAPSLAYALRYPWSFVDKVYLSRRFRENTLFLNAMQSFVRDYMARYDAFEIYTPILRHRMRLFARSRVLYALNAYARLIRVYLCRLLKKDAYADGHGI